MENNMKNQSLPPGQYLKNARAYLSGPIENDTSGLNWRIKPTKILTERFGINLFDPFADPKQQWVSVIKKAREDKDFETISTIARSFVRKDLAMVDRSDLIIAYLPPGVPTTGTHHEIINSTNAKKPTLLVSDGKENVPLWYYGFIPNEVIFGSWDELYDYLEQVNKGIHSGNHRWSFVYGLI